MKAPQYVTAPLKKAQYYFGKDGCPGYSIKIFKRTPYEYASTLRNRCDAIITWCNKQVAGSYPRSNRVTNHGAGNRPL